MLSLHKLPYVDLAHFLFVCLFVSNRNLVRFRYSLIPSANTVCLFLDVQFALMICQLLVLIYCMCPRINGYLDHSNGHFTK